MNNLTAYYMPDSVLICSQYHRNIKVPP